jgi:hypothetical protein
MLAVMFYFFYLFAKEGSSVRGSNGFGKDRLDITTFTR